MSKPQTKPNRGRPAPGRSRRASREARGEDEPDKGPDDAQGRGDGKQRGGRSKAFDRKLLKEPLPDLLERLQIDADKADYVVFADGSGASFSMGCGYAAVVLDLAEGSRELLFGGLSRGTVNIAESLAVLQALDFLVNKEDNKRAGKAGSRFIKSVHIVTDSQYCQTTGATGKGRLAKRNVGLWGLFESYARQGLTLHWHHIRRATCGLNVLCDAVAKLARLRLKDYNVAQEVSVKDGDLTLDKVNPDD